MRCNLDEIMEEYLAGYEKAYKNIPDLVAELRAARKVVEAAREIEEILSDVRGRAEIDSFTVQPLSLALKELDGEN